MARRILRAFLLVFAAAVAVPGVAAAATTARMARCGAPVRQVDDWRILRAKETRADLKRLCLLSAKLRRSPELNVHGVVVSRGGGLLFEVYGSGEDYNWGTWLGKKTYSAEKLHDVRSVSKSVVSLLVGIALDRKLIGSIDDAVFSYFPEYSDLRTPEKDLIKIEHLLTMTSGLAWNEEAPYNSPANTEQAMYGSSEPYRYVLERKTSEKPGEIWRYSSGDTMLLGAILQKVSGQSLSDFARDALFKPLGIEASEWTRVSASGEHAAGGGLRLRPRDMAKIGQLILEKGIWKGERIVSAKWIEDSVRPLYRGWGNDHGYQWWTEVSRVGSRNYRWIAAWGLGGQRIFIVPEAGLVVAITAGNYRSDVQSSISFDILDNFVLPALRD